MKVRMLSEQELDRLEKLEREATPVPWELDKHLNPNDISVWYKGTFLANLVEYNAEDGRYSLAFDLQRVEDAKFLAALRNAAPALIAAAREGIRLREAAKESLICLAGCLIMERMYPGTFAPGNLDKIKHAHDLTFEALATKQALTPEASHD